VPKANIDVLDRLLPLKLQLIL